MDQNRQIRFLIPPFFLFASLLLGAHLDPEINLIPFFTPTSTKSVLGVIAAGAVMVIPIGFFIGTLSVTILRIGFAIFSKEYEAVLSPETVKRIWNNLNVNIDYNEKFFLYAVATFDHELLPSQTHEWIVRRWNSFNIAVHSCTALILAHLVGRFVGINQDIVWLVVTVILIIVFAVNAAVSWRHTMEMIEFQSHREHHVEEVEHP